MTLSVENKALVERLWPAAGRPPQPSHGYNSIDDHTLNRLLDAARAEGREASFRAGFVAGANHALDYSDMGDGEPQDRALAAELARLGGIIAL